MLFGLEEIKGSKASVPEPCIGISPHELGEAKLMEGSMSRTRGSALPSKLCYCATLGYHGNDDDDW